LTSVVTGGTTIVPTAASASTATHKLPCEQA
jgi:hypothetical protein